MKIAFVCEAVYPYFQGGREKRLFEITTRLAKRGHDVHIYTMKWWKGSKIVKENGVTLHAISPLFKMYDKNGKRCISQALAFSFYCLQLPWESFDIIDADSMPHFPVFPSWVAAKMNNKPLIVTWHEKWGKYWLKYMGFSGIFGMAVERFAEMFTPKALAISQLTSKRLKVRKKVIIPNGISFDFINKVKPSKKNYDISYVGRLIKHKNVDLLIKVANKKGYKTVVMGSGPDERKLKALAGKTVEIVGRVETDEEIYANIKSSKVFVTLSEREGFGISIIEAMACGTPVITLDHPDNAGTALIYEGKNGYVVSKNEKVIELGIEACIKGSKEMSKSSLTTGKSFDWEKIVDKIEKLYGVRR